MGMMSPQSLLFLGAFPEQDHLPRQLWGQSQDPQDGSNDASLINGMLQVSILKTAKKKFEKPVKKAKNLDFKTVFSLVLSWLSSGDFKDKKSAVFILTQFLLFAWYEGIAQLKKSSIKSLELGDLEISFAKAKNYNVWDCKTSWVAKNSGGGFDPVQVIWSQISEMALWD